MSTNSSEMPAHPLEQMRDWIIEREGAAIPIVEFFSEGPSLLGVDEVTFREWVNEGMARRLITLGGLANIIQLVPDTTLDHDLPSEPPSRYGY